VRVIIAPSDTPFAGKSPDLTLFVGVIR